MAPVSAGARRLRAPAVVAPPGPSRRQLVGTGIRWPDRTVDAGIGRSARLLGVAGGCALRSVCHGVVPYTSRSRLCSGCGRLATDRRADGVFDELLDVPYHHVVLAVPVAAALPARREPVGRPVDLRPGGERLSRPATRKQHGMRLGVVSVLHAFGSDLEWHPQGQMTLIASPFTSGNGGREGSLRPRAHRTLAGGALKPRDGARRPPGNGAIDSSVSRPGRCR